MASLSKYGLIAGNGKFPFLVLEAARSQGIDMVVAAIKEETFPEIEQHAKTVHWMSLGQLGKLIKTFKSEGVNQAIMAGQVKHKQIFSSIVPEATLMSGCGASWSNRARTACKVTWRSALWLAVS